MATKISLVLGLFLLSLLGCSLGAVGGDEHGGADGAVVDAPPPIPGCRGACTVATSCPAGMPTTVSGTVTIPSGLLPVYGARVFVPIGEALPPPPTDGAACDRCDALTTAFTAQTDVEGRFTLGPIPSGENIPLIIQVGKWRRVLTLPSVADCSSTALPAGSTRLPRNQTEGHIPKMALSTGGADALECLLRKNKLGLDDSEFTNPTGNGRVNLFAGYQGTDKYAGGAAFPSSNPWWDSLGNWRQYDLVLMSCEGGRNLGARSVAARQALQTYLGLGGRAFASHWHNVWIQNAVPLPPPSTEPPLSTVAAFVPDMMMQDYANNTGLDEARINQGFEKGMALQAWMRNAAGLLPNGTVPVNYSRATLAAQNRNVMPPTMNPDPLLTQSWLALTKTNAGALPASLANPPSQYFTFNTPLGRPRSQQCGQMVFTDLHVSGAPVGAPGDHSSPSLPFPSGCTSTGLSPQEMVLLFLYFDLASCLQTAPG